MIRTICTPLIETCMKMFSMHPLSIKFTIHEIPKHAPDDNIKPKPRQKDGPIWS